MPTALATKDKDDQRVARPLRVLVPLIKDELQQGDAAGLEHYRLAGEMLLEAKEQVEYGEWKAWVARNFELSHSTANRYMAFAEESKKTRRRVFTTLSEATEPSRTTHQPAWHEQVKQVVDRVDTQTLNLKREELKRGDEREAQRELALQLIDIGYKVLARTLHPDKGGSRDAMSRLNAVRDRLKQNA